MESLNPFIILFNKVVKADYQKLPLETKWMIADLKKSYKEVIGYLFIPLLAISFHSNILINYTSEQLGVIKIHKLLNYSVINNWLFSLIVIFTISYIYIYKIYTLQLVPTIISRIRFGLIIFLYVFYFKQSNIFYCFEDSPSIFYVDSLIFCLCAFSLNLKPYQSYNPITNSIFIEENSKLRLQDDGLKRAEYSKKIVDEINNLKTENSFSIAVVGEWGIGKSTFMNFLEENLVEDNRNIIVKYNPWKVKNPDLMLEDFFTSFINEVGKLDHDLKNNLIKYSRYLTESEFKDNWVIKIIGFVLTFFDQPKSLSEQIDEINNRLEQTGKKFIIFIDDIDRLTGEEIFQILKLLRTTVDFKNVIFIAGIDLEYVQQSIGNSSIQIHKSDKYLNKIFQLEIFLPPFDKSTVISQIMKLLQIHDSDTEKIRECLNSISQFLNTEKHLNKNILEFFLNSYREVNRFVNAFNLSYKMVGDYVDLYDLILIEILKVKYSKIYQKFADKSLLEKYSLLNEPIDGDYTVKVTDTLKEAYLKQIILEDHENVGFLISQIYPASKKDKSINKSYKSIIYRENHDLYYNYLNIGKVGSREFENIVSKPIELIFKEIEVLRKQEKFFDFYKKLIDKISLIRFENEEPEPLILLWIEISDSENEAIIEQILRKILFQRNYYKVPSSNTIIDIFLKYLQNESVSLEKRLNLTQAYIWQCINPIKKEIYTIDDIESINKVKKINSQNFKLYIEQETNLSKKTFHNLYNNIDKIENDKLILTEYSLKLFRNFINNHKEDYLKLVLRPRDSRSNNIFVFETYLEDTFKDLDEDNGFENFEKFLNDFEGDQKLKDFISEYFEIYKNNPFDPKSIKLNEEDIKYLNEIQAKFKTEH